MDAIIGPDTLRIRLTMIMSSSCCKLRKSTALYCTALRGSRIVILKSDGNKTLSRIGEDRFTLYGQQS